MSDSGTPLQDAERLADWLDKEAGHADVEWEDGAGDVYRQAAALLRSSREENERLKIEQRNYRVEKSLQIAQQAEQITTLQAENARLKADAAICSEHDEVLGLAYRLKSAEAAHRAQSEQITTLQSDNESIGRIAFAEKRRADAAEAQLREARAQGQNDVLGLLSVELAAEIASDLSARAASERKEGAS